MPKKIQEITITTVSTTLVEDAINIDVPTGKVIKINSIKFMGNAIGTAKVGNQQLWLAAASKDTEETVLSNDTIINEGQLIGADTLIGEVNSSSPVIKTSGELVMFGDAYALKPTLLLGQAIVAASGAEVKVVVVIDYDLVKLSIDIATELASK